MLFFKDFGIAREHALKHLLVWEVPHGASLFLFGSLSHGIFFLLLAFMMVPDGLILEWPFGAKISPIMKSGQAIVSKVLPPVRSHLGCVLLSLYPILVFVV